MTRAAIVDAGGSNAARSTQPIKRNSDKWNAGSLLEKVDNSKSAVLARIDRDQRAVDLYGGARRLDLHPPKFLSEMLGDGDVAERDRLAFKRGRAILDSLPPRLTMGLKRHELRDITRALGQAHLARTLRLREEERRAFKAVVR